MVIGQIVKCKTGIEGEIIEIRKHTVKLNIVDLKTKAIKTIVKKLRQLEAV